MSTRLTKENLLVVTLGVLCIVLWCFLFLYPWGPKEQLANTQQAVAGIQKLEITFLDVGQGDAAIIKTPQGKYFLVDAGAYSGASVTESDAGQLLTELDAGKDVILPYLKKHKISELEGIILSHPHIDHYGGLLSKRLVQLTTGYIIEFGEYYEEPLYKFLLTANKGGQGKEFLSILYEIPVKWFADPGVPDSMPEYLILLSLLKAKKIKYIIPQAGQQLDLGDPSIKATVLGPQGNYMLETESGVNNSSLVIKLEYKNVSVLFTGDIELAAELDLLEQKQKFKSTLLKVAHHGSRTSSSLPFLDYVKPEVAVISCGRGNPYGHPHEETLSTLDYLKIKYYRTDQNGNITFSTDGVEYTISTE
ncbi:MAG: ComEC/Rec2 family competence protein [Elusimicrobiota bacterium]|nr:ComEC/Rec2 family competence protein [Elusimicrobiota bacterium]